MSQPASCPKCGTTEFKIKTVKINPNTGERLSMFFTVSGAVLLSIGLLLALLGLANLPNKGSDGALFLFVAVIFFITPGVYLLYPWIKGGQEPLIRYECKKCRHRWCWMEKYEIHLLKAWLPGPLNIPSQTWMELGPNWFTLKDFDKHFDIRKDKASRQIEFLSTTYTGTNSDLTGQPMVNVGSPNGTIAGIVLEADGFEKLRQWVPPATVKDVQIMTLRTELQNWGKGFLFLGLLQGFIMVNLRSPSSINTFGLFWALALIMIGLLGMAFSTPLLLLADAAVVAIAGLLNIASGVSPWTILGVLQIICAVALCWRFFYFLGAPKQPTEPEKVPAITPSTPPTPVQLDDTAPLDEVPMPDPDEIVHV